MEVFSLRRRNAELAAKLVTANNKLTRALEALFSLRRFLRLWILEGQGESYDQIHGRMKHLDGTIDYLEDRSVGDPPALDIPERWRK
jgi:hypothetical protein